MTKQLRQACMSFMVWAGCHHVICSFWRALEIAAYGTVSPSDIDTVISLLFSVTLWRLMCNWWEWN